MKRDSLKSRECDYRLLPGESRRRVRSGTEELEYTVSECSSKNIGTLLLLHGLASNGSRWEEFAEKTELRKHWKIIRTDLRGHGANNSRVRGTLEVFARDCEAILKAECAREVIVIGHSLGAHVAMKMVVMYPNRIRGIVLLDPLISSALTISARKKMRWLPIIRMVEAVVRLLNALGVRRHLKPYSLRDEDERAREMLRQGGDAQRNFIKEFSSPFNEIPHVHLATYARDVLEVARKTPDAKALSLPLFLICSFSGMFTDPAKISEWIEEIPQGKMELIHCNHWPLTECPEQIRSLVKLWIDELIQVSRDIER